MMKTFNQPGWAVALVTLMSWGWTAAVETTMPDVPPADLAKLKPGDFRDDELAVPFYLSHFHRLANSIEQTGPNRGFITLPVWRPKEHNKPYNARVLENHIALAYFYCTDRPWNPYHARPAVRSRLEALLDFWCRAQNKDGWFSEYRPKGWNLPATGFAAMFMGETLRLLHAGPPIDRAIHRRTIAAHKKAVHALLTSQRLFNGGKKYSNQYSGLWGGALAYLDPHPDAKLSALIRPRLVQSVRDHQSPVGYWYEAGGCDWAYTLRTHNGNLLMAWHYARGTDLETPFIHGETRWAEWVAYNAAREPDGSVHVLNRAIETRTRGTFRRRHSPISERVPLARAFVPTRSEVRRATEAARRQLGEGWPRVAPLEVGNHHAYSPHVLLNLTHRRWYPTHSQRDEAVAQLPCLARRRFNHQRCDDRGAQAYTFVRRDAYYAAFNAGKRLTRQQRFGLGMVWTDRAGVLLQSQTGSHEAAWGTLAAGSKDVYETELTGATSQVAGKTVQPEPGARDLNEGELTVTYPLRGKGRKTLTFADDHIAVRIEHGGEFVEVLPLLVPRGMELRTGEGTAALGSGGNILEIGFEPKGTAKTRECDVVVAGKRMTVLRIEARDALAYRIGFPQGGGPK